MLLGQVQAQPVQRSHQWHIPLAAASLADSLNGDQRVCLGKSEALELRRNA